MPAADVSTGASLAPPSRGRRLRRWWRTRVLARRRLLAALCLVVASLATLRTLAPPPPPVDSVLVAAQDLPAGSVLGAGDVVEAAWARGTAPDGVVGAPQGRTLASPLRRGEPVTDARLLTPDLMEGHPGRVAVPVRVVDPAAVEVLRIGDEVDLLSADPARSAVETVARAARVAALPVDPEGLSGQATAGRLVVLAVRPDEVEPVTLAAVGQFLTVVWSR